MLELFNSLKLMKCANRFNLAHVLAIYCESRHLRSSTPLCEDCASVTSMHVKCMFFLVNRPAFELTLKSWTNFKGFCGKVQKRFKAQGRQELFPKGRRGDPMISSACALSGQLMALKMLRLLITTEGISYEKIASHPPR